LSVAEAQPINLIVRERAKLQARVEAAKVRLPDALCRHEQGRRKLIRVLFLGALRLWPRTCPGKSR